MYLLCVTCVSTVHVTVLWYPESLFHYLNIFLFPYFSFFLSSMNNFSWHKYFSLLSQSLLKQSIKLALISVPSVMLMQCWLFALIIPCCLPSSVHHLRCKGNNHLDEMNKQELFNILNRPPSQNSLIIHLNAPCLRIAFQHPLPQPWKPSSCLWIPLIILESTDPTIEDTFYEQCVLWGHDEFQKSLRLSCLTG